MIFDTRDWTPSTWAKAGSHAQPELGWALTRAYWGHGYATEAAAAIRDWAHECPNIDRLVSLISPDNIRSQRVARRLSAIPTEKPWCPQIRNGRRSSGDIRASSNQGGSGDIPEHWPMRASVELQPDARVLRGGGPQPLARDVLSQTEIMRAKRHETCASRC